MNVGAKIENECTSNLQYAHNIVIFSKYQFVFTATNNIKIMKLVKMKWRQYLHVWFKPVFYPWQWSLVPLILLCQIHLSSTHIIQYCRESMKSSHYLVGRWQNFHCCSLWFPSRSRMINSGTPHMTSTRSMKSGIMVSAITLFINTFLRNFK